VKQSISTSQIIRPYLNNLSDSPAYSKVSHIFPTISTGQTTVFHKEWSPPLPFLPNKSLVILFIVKLKSNEIIDGDCLWASRVGYRASGVRNPQALASIPHTAPPTGPERGVFSTIPHSSPRPGSRPRPWPGNAPVKY